MAPATSGVLIVGGGVAGALLALALRDRGRSVTLLDAPPELGGVFSASAISYGALPGWPLSASPLAQLSASAGDAWQLLQKRYGDLGWHGSRLRVQGERPLLSGLARWLPLPFSQVDSARLMARLPALLAAAGVVHCHGVAQGLAPGNGSDRPWQVHLGSGATLMASQLVLAAGSGCAALWPPLRGALGCSWAAVLKLPGFPAGFGRPAAWLPSRFARVALEQRSGALLRPEWVVDAGLVPRADGALLGQLSLIRPVEQADPPLAAAWAEQQLRQGLRQQAWALPLAEQPGELLQASVAFRPGGLPLVGAWPEAAGLWLFTGFSAGFSQSVVLAPLLADALCNGAGGEAGHRLQQLGVWPSWRTLH